MTYEPYLSTVRANPEAGKIIATTLDYPMIMDTFGCTPKFLADNPKAAQAIADSYFEAVGMISKDPKRSFEIMGARREADGRAVRSSQKYLRWQDKAANQKFFAGEHQAFSKEAAELLLEVGIIKSIPDIASIVDTGSSSDRHSRVGGNAETGCDDPFKPRHPRRPARTGRRVLRVVLRGVGGGHPRRLRAEDLPRRSRSRCCAGLRAVRAAWFAKRHRASPCGACSAGS